MFTVSLSLLLSIDCDVQTLCAPRELHAQRLNLQFMLYRWRAEEVRIATLLLNVAGYGCANKHNET